MAHWVAEAERRGFEIGFLGVSVPKAEAVGAGALAAVTSLANRN